MAGDHPLNLSGRRLESIRRRLAARLSPDRYAHSLSTALWSAVLAKTVGVPPERAYLAGLLHDCARELPDNELKTILKKYRSRFLLSDTLDKPGLWHDAAGAYLALHEYRVHDTGILRALAIHSTGAPYMRPLDKVLFVADYTEPLRPFVKEGLRRLAMENLDAAVAAVVRSKLAYLQAENLPIHSETLALAKQLGVDLPEPPARTFSKQ